MASRAARTGVIGVVASVVLLFGAMAPVGATVTELPPTTPVAGGFTDTDAAVPTRTSSLALDSAGGTHLALDRSAARGTYAYCPPGTDCVTPAQWAKVDLVTDAYLMMAPPQLKLTPAGKPRILFAVGDSNFGLFYRYAACDNACTTLAGWAVLDLASRFSPPSDRSYGAHFFALNPQGLPRFVYQNNGDRAGLGYAFCDVGCAASTANWSETTVSQGTGLLTGYDYLFTSYASLSLRFDAAGRPRVAGYSHDVPRRGFGVLRTAYLQCDSACEAPEPEPPAAPNWTVTVISEQIGPPLLVLDNNGAPHIAVAGEVIAAPLMWFSCATACGTAANWSNHPVGVDAADVDLAFDSSNRPRLALNGAAAVGLRYMPRATWRATPPARNGGSRRSTAGSPSTPPSP